MTDPISQAVSRGDLDELTRLIDGLCSSREWDELLRLRDQCRRATDRGLQLWPAAEFAEYRMALEAPASWAGSVVKEGAGRFALGPLWEVAASTHTWDELAPYLEAGPARAMAAHERVVRGEDLEGDTSIDEEVLEIPLCLQPWEPEYMVASYEARRATFPSPSRPRPATPIEAGFITTESGGEAAEALLAVGRVWTEQSNGDCRVAAVRGSAEEAVAALAAGEVLLSEVGTRSSLAHLAWAAASGGAYGRRPGTPAGRFAAWWVVASVAGLEWPVVGADLGAAAERLRWVMWEPPGKQPGWSLRLAMADPASGMAWAIEAIDMRREADGGESPG